MDKADKNIVLKDANGKERKFDTFNDAYRYLESNPVAKELNPEAYSSLTKRQGGIELEPNRLH